MNWLDLIIIAGIIFAAYMGVRNGFYYGVIELSNIFFSIVIPLFLWELGIPFVKLLGVPQAYTGIASYVLILAFVMIAYLSITRYVYKKYIKDRFESKTNSYLGIIPGAIEGLIIISMLVTLFAFIPNSPISQNTINKSCFAQAINTNMMGLVEALDKSFGPSIRNIMGFITVNPSSNETVSLGYKAVNVSINEDAENEMLALVNKERTNRGLNPLVLDPNIRIVARNYSAYMLKNGFFSHTGIDGSTPLMRMTAEGIRFTMVGENLAYAPTVSMAHRGLMNSKSHRENILNPNYTRIGIGIVSAGAYKVMYTQNFAR